MILGAGLDSLPSQPGVDGVTQAFHWPRKDGALHCPIPPGDGEQEGLCNCACLEGVRWGVYLGIPGHDELSRDANKTDALTQGRSKSPLVSFPQVPVSFSSLIL